MSEYESDPPPRVPETDRLRVESQPPAKPRSFPKIVSVPGTPDTKEISQGAQPLRYPFTKGVSLRNDGVGYGEIIVEKFACYVAGGFVASEERSLRTRTSRTFPPAGNGQSARAVPPPDVRSLASVASPQQVAAVALPRSPKVPADL